MSTRSQHSIDYFPTPANPHLRGWASYDREISGGNTPRELRAVGEFTENGYSGHTELQFNPLIEVAWESWSAIHWVEGSAYSNGFKPIPESVLPDMSAYDLLPKLAQAWKESDFNVGVFAAEGKDAIGMMANRLRGLYNGTKALGKGNIGGFLRELTGSVPKGSRRNMQKRMDLGDVSGAFLEGHLGWSPMLGDLYDLAGLIKPKEIQNVVRASHTYIGAVRAAAQPPEMYSASGHHKKTIAIKCIVTREPTWIDRLGLNDPAGILWEATPLSFVIDYVSPIGKALASIHAVGNLPVKQLVLTRHEEFEGVIKVLKAGNAYWYLSESVRNNPLPSVSKYYVTSRSIHGSIHDVISGWAFMPTNITPKWDKGLKQLGILSSLVHQGFLSHLHPSAPDLARSLEDIRLPRGR